MARSGRTKGKAKEDIALFPEYILQSTEELEVLLSKKQHIPITLELGMGAGDMLLVMAKNNPKGFFIGIELKEERCLKMAVRARKQGIQNIVCVCLPAAHVYPVIHSSPVDNVWITFPDPWPKKRHRWRRFITYSTVTHILHLLRPSGNIFFKTDHQELFEDTHLILRHSFCRILFSTSDLHASEFHHKEMTAFEKRYTNQGKPIFLLHAQKIGS